MDPAGKWKTMTSDAMGNLVTVTEPDPQLGTDTTSYTYNAANQLLTVTMPRSNGTQTRTFQWTGGDMTSATNPENGTVTYTYDGAHRVKTRIDAKGQKTQYSYDSFGRNTMVQHYNAAGVEQTNQRVTYTFGDNYDAPTFSQNAWGRLAQVTFGNETSSASTSPQFQYLYSYTSSGRVTTKRMWLGLASNLNLDANYQWDNEGKMTSMVPPGTGANKYYYFYDALGRLSNMTEATCPGGNCNPTGTTVATATYGVAGQITALTYDSFSETRTYNSLLQLTRMTATSGGQTVMDMLYTFSPTQNNGRISQSTDNVSGETVVYTYDTLNRLVSAAASGSAWSETYTYDGFGNLTAKTPTGTAPAMAASYDLSNHQVGQSYDANGNTGLSGTFPYDVENHLLQPLVSGTGTQWSYDDSGKRVFAQSSTICEFYFYGMAGEKLLTYDCLASQVKNRNLYFADKLMRSEGVTVVTDRLGTVRANSVGERMNYFPYGEEKTATANGREKFGTYLRDSGGVDYADQRYYASINARFLTADPTLNNVDYNVSASWNAYAFVNGDPINFNDPSGLAISFSGAASAPCGSLQVVGGIFGGETVSQVMTDTTSGGNLLAQLVWHEDGTIYLSDIYDTISYNADMIAVASAVLNQVDVDDGNIMIWQAGKRVCPLGACLDRSLRQILVGTDLASDSAGRLFDSSGKMRTDQSSSQLPSILNTPANAYPAVLDGKPTNVNCEGVLEAIKNTSNVSDGTTARSNPNGLILLYWNKLPATTDPSLPGYSPWRSPRAQGHTFWGLPAGSPPPRRPPPRR